MTFRAVSKELERGHLEPCESIADDILHLMAEYKIIQPDEVHSWEKMLVHPKPGESLLSWIMRQTWAFGITPKRLIQSEKEYWLLKEGISLSLPREQYWPVIIDVLPVSSAWENVLHHRGLNKGFNELQLNISKWLDLVKEPEVTRHRLQNYYHYGLRYCPLCWKDDNSRYFRILWRLPFVLVCLEHGVGLKEFCSSCGELLFDDKRHRKSSSILLQNFCEKWLINCRHCNHSLLDDGAEENSELALLQKQILDTLLSDSNWATSNGYLIFWHTYLTSVERQKPDCAETRLKFMDAILKTLQFVPNPNHYSQELLQKSSEGCKL